MMVVTLMHAIGDRAIVEQGGKNFADLLGDLFKTHYV